MIVEKDNNSSSKIFDDSIKKIVISSKKEDIKNFIKQMKLIYSGKFYQYKAGYYQEVEQIELKKIISDSEIETKHAKNRIENILDGLKLNASKKANDINPSKYINLNNGIFNTETYKLEKHTPEIFTTIRIPVEYKENAEISSIFEKFLTSSIPNETSRKVIQEYFGYVLSCDNKHHSALFLIGDGGNGKGILMQILNALVGKKNISVLDIPDFSKDTNRSQLLGKAVNISTEMSGEIKSTAFKIFKQLVSFEAITGKFLFNDPFIFTPTAKFIFSVNNKPRFPENNEATFRRVLFIEFPNIFGEVSEGAKHQKDGDLFPKIKKDMSGVFNWAIQGLKRLRSQGKFSQDPELLERKRLLRIKADSIGSFINEKCIIKPTVEIVKDNIYNEYKNYCENYDIEPDNDKVFGKTIKLIPNVMSKRKTINANKATVYIGICIDETKNL